MTDSTTLPKTFTTPLYGHEKPVIITGGPRTGTTLTMAFLEACGMVIGKTAERSPLKEGDIRDKFYKPVLKEGGFDPLAQGTLPPPGWYPTGRDIKADRQLVKACFGWPEDKRFGVQPWGFKAIKGLLFYPYLNAMFPEGIKWVVVHREVESWIGSLMRTGFMNKYTTEEGWRCYTERIQLRQNALIDMTDEPHEIATFFPSAFRAVNTPAGEEMLKDLCQYVGVPYSRAAALRIFDPGKYKEAR